MRGGQLAWYLVGVGSWFVPQGMLSVLVPWVVSVELGLGGDRLGLAQSMFTLPALLFILAGGVVADYADERRILISLHAAVSVPALLIGWLAWDGRLSYSLLLVYLFCTGTGSAFIRPARDSLLTQVAGGNVQGAVTAATGTQFGVQTLGFLLASSVELLGSGPLFKLMAGLLLVGAFAASRIAVAPVRRARSAMPGVRELREGLSIVRRSALLFPVALLNVVVGVFFIGTYFVVVPILVLRVYAGGAADLAFANVCFMMGTLSSTLLLLRVGGVRRGHSRALLTGALINSLIIGSLGLHPPQWLFLGLLFSWGASTGVAMSMGRTLVQEQAPASHRARVLAIYAFTLLGGGPLGGVLMGYLAEGLGPSSAALISSAATATAILTLAATTSLWRGPA